MRTVTFNNHHLAIKMLTKAFAAYTKILRNICVYMTNITRLFEDFLSVLHPLSNARLTHQNN